MSSKSVKVYKNFPLNYKIRKPRYWYVDKTITPSSSIVIEENLEAFEGIEIPADENKLLNIPIIDLWNGTKTSYGRYIYARKDEEYFAVIDDETTSSGKNVVMAKGLAEISNPFGFNTKYTMYRDENGETFLQFGENVDINGNIIDPDGKTFFGYLDIPPYFDPQSNYFKKRYSEGNDNYKYTVDNDNNILINLSPRGTLSFEDEKFYYTFIPETPYFEYAFRYTTKITSGSNVTSSKVYGVIGAPSWIGFCSSSGQFGVYNGLKTSAGLSTNTTYWIRISEVYSVSSGQYTHKIAYIKDNGYTKNTLPDESQWTVVSSSDSTRWFDATKYVKFFGDSNPAGEFSWNGTIDLNNTWIDSGALSGNGVWRYTEQWSPLIKYSDVSTDIEKETM